GVTACHDAREFARMIKTTNDAYSWHIVQALGDRLAEAMAAYLHARVQGEWGIDQRLSPEQIIAEAHRGIRPGFGYPACPDHSEKFKLFDLLDASDAQITLTEHAAMMPAASVSGLYFAHPAAHYFSVGRIGEDQILNYARRKGQSVDEVERWLASNLAYERARC